ncbi:hypothetical protein [Pseudochryseolinea flava]|uniref:Uncharacterized protein n=1 Tax=Pseudochryseolinea flava TaxID=2059302 RepID=A0A364YC99_9BACT|nr:hypothetical protein [Pseudochryseolinea flava]RAW03348.1 hypothetical protein DQQ10_04490 [Pseudochryseolinea flava]
MTKFFIALLSSAILIATGCLVGSAEAYWLVPSYFLETLLLLAFATGFLYIYLDRAAKDMFVQMYLLTITVKILAFGAYILIIVLSDQAHALGNVVFFMVAYSVFTALEIVFLYRKKTRS